MAEDVWRPDRSREEDAARRETLQRLAAAARRLGMPREQLVQLIRKLQDSEADTRRLLANEVYGVPDELLDDLLRVRLEDLEE